MSPVRPYPCISGTGMEYGFTSSIGMKYVCISFVQLIAEKFEPIWITIWGKIRVCIVHCSQLI